MARSEFFSKPPHSLHVKRENRHLSVVERHLAMLRLAEEEKHMTMEDEKTIIAHMMDYTDDRIVDDDGFPFETRYQVPDSVPDMYVPKIEEKKFEENPVKENPVKEE